LREVFGSRHVEQGASIDLGPLLTQTNEPDPAASVLRRPVTEFRDENPGPSDLLLVAEVTVATHEYDLGAKAALYASAGIPEYWVLDLRGMRIVVHRDPVGEHYGSIAGYSADEAVSPLAAPSALVRLQDFLR
jgi:Uma2 family endonuclease